VTGLAAKRLMIGSAGGIATAALALAEGASSSVAALSAADVAALVFVEWVWALAAAAELARRADARLRVLSVSPITTEPMLDGSLKSSRRP
jgi:hypothetical protein